MNLNILNTIATFVFLINIIIFIVFSLILNYHWKRYEISISKTSIIKKIYFTVSIIILIIILLFYFIIVFKN